MAVSTGEPTVIVRQEFEEETPVLVRPILAPVMVGLSYQIVEEASAGLYNGSSLILTYPDIKAGAVVLTDEVEVGLTTVEDRFDITDLVTITTTNVTIPGSLTPEKQILGNTQVNTVSGTILTDTNQDYFNLGVRKGDVVQFVLDSTEHEVGGSVESNQPGDYVVIAIPEPTKLEVRGTVPASHAGSVEGPFTITDSTNDTVDLDIDGTNITVDIPDTDTSVQDVADTLNGNAPFSALAIADGWIDKLGREFLRIRTLSQGPGSSIQFNTPTNSAHTTLGLGVKAQVTGTASEPFNITTGTNDQVKLTINGTSISAIALPNGALSAQDVATALNNVPAFDAEATASDVDGKVRITSDQATDSEIEIETVANDAYTDLGLTVGNFFGVVSGSNQQPLISEDNVEYTIERRGSSSGNVDISYRARRTDNTNTLFEAQDLTTLENELGPAVPDNPLSYAMSLALQNSDLSVLGVAVEDESIGSFQDAFDFLQNEDVWGMVPLTQDETIHQLAQAHVNLMSQPEEGSERVVFLNQEVPLFVVKQETRSLDSDPTGGGPYPTSTFEDLGAEFVTNEVVPGDRIYVTDLTGTIEIDGVDQGVASTDDPIVLIVGNVVSETEVEIVGEFTSGTSITDLDYRVRTDDFTKFEIAQEIKDTISVVQDRRVIYLHPDTVEAAHPETGDEIEIPGYFVAAALAGQASALKPSQGHSTLPVAGFTGLQRSNGFFSKEQLDTISQGGVWIMVQRTETSPINTRRQLTSDVSSLERAEFSVTKVTDFGSKYFRQQLRPLLGRNNVSKRFIERQLRPAAEAVIRDLVEDFIVGKGTRIRTLAQNQDQPDRIDVVVDWRVFAPVNQIDITLSIAFQLVEG